TIADRRARRGSAVVARITNGVLVSIKLRWVIANLYRHSPSDAAGGRTIIDAIWNFVTVSIGRTQLLAKPLQMVSVDSTNDIVATRRCPVVCQHHPKPLRVQ